ELAEREGELGLCRHRRLRTDVEQVEELDVVKLWQAIETVQDGLGEPRVELDERDAGVRIVEIGPFGRIARYSGFRLFHQVGEGPVVQFWRVERHRVCLFSGVLR